jgi:hypothetical protein
MPLDEVRFLTRNGGSFIAGDALLCLHRLRFRRWVSQNLSPNLLVGQIEEPPQKCNQGRLFD